MQVIGNSKEKKFDTVSLFIIGTELTRGIIKDGHVPFLTSELSELGFNVKRAVIVPDDGTIKSGLEEAASDSSCILVTGGLGPTSDDLTRSIIASLAGVKLVKNEKAWKHLYEQVGERAYGANAQQAMIPQGFELIENGHGTAPGFRGFFEKDGRTVFIASMPGPPAEMQPMFFDYVKPYMADLIGAENQQRDEFSVYLIAEAKLEELCRKCATEGISWGTRFQAFKISLYITGSDAAGRKAFVEKLRALAGPALIVDGGDTEACSLLCRYLKDNALTISTAESCTSGLVAKMLTDTAGSSAWFWGGVVSYDNTAKMKLLGVKKETLDTFGAVSCETAREMADGIRKVSGTDLAVSVTGIAGPDGGTPDKPVGTVCFGFSSFSRETVAVCIKNTWIKRDSSRRRFAVCAMILALLYAQGADIVDISNRWLYI